MATSGMLPPPPSETEPWSEKDFAPIISFLRHQIGITLEPHRMGLLQARLRSRLQVKGFPSFTQFHEQVLKVEIQRLGRPAPDRPEHGQSHLVLPRAGAFHVPRRAGRSALREAPGSTVRLWSAGCSSGQEPYSMAMVLAEILPPHGLAKVEIWASDLSLEMLKVAAGAIYTTRDVQGVSPARLRRFFLLGRGPREGSFRIVPEIRDLVKFRHLDLRNSIWAVPNDFHVIFCRNVSIYFAEDERLVLAGPPRAAPPSRGLAGDGQRRDPAVGAGLAAQAFAVALPEGGLIAHGPSRSSASAEPASPAAPARSR